MHDQQPTNAGAAEPHPGGEGLLFKLRGSHPPTRLVDGAAEGDSVEHKSD